MIEDVQELPKLLVLPKTISEQARILTLPHPRTAVPTRYYFCPETGLYEFTRIATPKSTYRSLLVTPTPEIEEENIGLASGESSNVSRRIGDHDGDGEILNLNTKVDKVPLAATPEAYISKTAEFYTVTPFDPLFVLVPVLYSSPSDARTAQAKELFRSSEDLFDSLCDFSSHFKQLSNHENTRVILENRLGATCDIVQAGDEKMYRLNEEKLLKELLSKAQRMVSSGLPASMEEKFVRKALEMPVINIKRQESSFCEAAPDEDPAKELSTPETTDSQLSTSTCLTNTSQSSTNTNITVPDQSSTPPVSPHVVHLLRLRTALSYIIYAYLSRPISSLISNLLASPSSPIDFQPLNTQLSTIAALRAEMIASRSMADFSLKRNMDGDDEEAEMKAEKKRKKEEEEKRKKAGESRGVRDLKKVDTRGMKKMSDFFGKGGGGGGKEKIKES